MMTSYYPSQQTNYNYPYPKATTIPSDSFASSSTTTSAFDYNSIYSMTPFVSVSPPPQPHQHQAVNSPSMSTVTTVSSPHKKNVHFYFQAPELMKASLSSLSLASTTTSSSALNENSDTGNRSLIPFQQNNKSFKLHVPRSRNAHGSDAVHPDKFKMKTNRKKKTAVAATSGAIIGGVCFGPAWPLGVVVGGAFGGVVGKQLAKVGERRAQRKFEQNSFQQTASLKSHQWCQGDGAVFA
jgi:hypothetical protein